MIELGLLQTKVEPPSGASPALCSKPIYLDHHATTPVDPRVTKMVVHAMTDVYGNANSVDHAYGEAAAELVESARRSVAALVGAAPGNVHFTSGSTQAIGIALSHAKIGRASCRERVCQYV